MSSTYTIPARLNYSSVRYVEIDKSSFVTASTSLNFGAILQATNGPVLDITSISHKDTLESLYGAPTDDNFVEWFNIKRVFDYKSGQIGGNGLICRVVGDGSYNQALAVTDTKIVDEADLTTTYIGNENDVDNTTIVFDTADDDTDTKVKFFSKYPTEETYYIALATADDFATANVYTGVSFADLDEFSVAPEDTEVAIVVLDEDYEVIEGLLVDMTDGNTDDNGENNYIETSVNDNSAYILAYVNSANENDIISFEATKMLLGTNVAPTTADYIEGVDLYEDVESVDINYFLGNNEVIQEMNTICVNRQDCQLIWSVPTSVIKGKTNTNAAADLATYVSETENFTSNYAEFFGNIGYVYDEYAVKNRWVELAGDVLGLRILKNLTGNPWNASAGLNNGQIRNIIKLGVNFTPSQLNTLGANKGKVNPIINKKGKGIFSWGIQNYTKNTSALEDSTTRGLLVTIWRAMRDALEYTLFEINDEITRGEVQKKVQKFMEGIEANRGVSNTGGLDAFTVICDETNNTDSIIDNGQMVLTIKLVPSRAVKEIILQSVVSSTGTDLTES